MTEFLTAAALVVAGYGIRSRRAWAIPLILVALGELIYCAIRFAEELGQDGSLAGLIFFTFVGASGIFFAIDLVISTMEQLSKT